VRKEFCNFRRAYVPAVDYRKVGNVWKQCNAALYERHGEQLVVAVVDPAELQRGQVGVALAVGLQSLNQRVTHEDVALDV